MIAAQRNRSVTGVMMLLAAVTMLFAAFTSAMVVRRGLSGDWISTPPPGILWVNTVVLVGSSLLLLTHSAPLKTQSPGTGRSVHWRKSWKRIALPPSLFELLRTSRLGHCSQSPPGSTSRMDEFLLAANFYCCCCCCCC